MNDRHVLTRVAIGAGAVVLAVTMTGCGGSGKKKSKGKAKVKAGTEQRIDLVCADAIGDVMKARKVQTPGWVDLKSVTWDRADDGALVSFTPAALPQPNSAGIVTYTTTVRQGAVATFVNARLAKGRWLVTSGLRKPVRLNVVPAIVNGAITMKLPLQLPVDGRMIDLSREAQAGAEARGMARRVAFRDPECAATAPQNARARKRVFVAWPVQIEAKAPKLPKAKTSSGTRSKGKKRR